VVLRCVPRFERVTEEAAYRAWDNSAPSQWPSCRTLTRPPRAVLRDEGGPRFVKGARGRLSDAERQRPARQRHGRAVLRESLRLGAESSNRPAALLPARSPAPNEPRVSHDTHGGCVTIPT
jgi:hypothetical protein